MTSHLEHRLSSALRTAGDRPYVDVDTAWQQLGTDDGVRRTSTPRRRGPLIAAGVAAVMVATLALTVTAIGTPRPLDAALEAPAPTPGVSWTSFTFTSPTVGYATGNICPKGGPVAGCTVLRATHDSGRTWTTVPDPPGPIEQLLGAADGGLYAVEGGGFVGGIRWSGDGGRSWAPVVVPRSFSVEAGPYTPYVISGDDLVVDAALRQQPYGCGPGLLRIHHTTVQAAANATPPSVAQGLSAGRDGSLWWISASPQRACAGRVSQSAGTVTTWTSTDTARTWRRVTATPGHPWWSQVFPADAGTAFSVDTVSTGSLPAADGTVRLAVTHDGGRTWAGLPVFHVRAPPTGGPGLRTLTPFETPRGLALDAHHLLLAAGPDVTSSTDGGLTYRATVTGNPDSMQLLGGGVRKAFAFDVTTGRLRSSTDGGATWAALTTP